MVQRMCQNVFDGLNDETGRAIVGYRGIYILNTYLNSRNHGPTVTKYNYDLNAFTSLKHIVPCGHERAKMISENGHVGSSHTFD